MIEGYRKPLQENWDAALWEHTRFGKDPGLAELTEISVPTLSLL